MQIPERICPFSLHLYSEGKVESLQQTGVQTVCLHICKCCFRSTKSDLSLEVQGIIQPAIFSV